MSNSYPPHPPSFEPGYPPGMPPRKRGLSLAMWVLIGILVGGSVLLIGCIGVGYFVFGNAFNTNPEQVAEMTQSMVTVDVPEYWSPFMSMNMMGVRMAFYRGESSGSVLLFVDSAQHAQLSDEDFETQMRQQMERQRGPGREERTEEIESRDVTWNVRGEPTEFTVRETKGVDSGVIYHEILGSFPGNKRRTFLNVKAPADEFGEEDVRQMIESIQ